MAFRSLRAEGPFTDEPYIEPYWALFLDEERVTATTMEIDHAVDPVAVDHHCDPSIDCSFKRFVAARRVGQAVVWISPPSMRVPVHSRPGVLEALDRGPVWFRDTEYAAWLESLEIDAASVLEQLKRPSARELEELLWAGVAPQLGSPFRWPDDDAWRPDWAALAGDRLWIGAEPADHPLAPALLEAATLDPGRVELDDVIDRLPAGACVLAEVLGAEGDHLIRRFAMAQEGDQAALFLALGGGVWGRTSAGRGTSA